MTRDEILKRYPNASESFIAANLVPENLPPSTILWHNMKTGENVATTTGNPPKKRHKFSAKPTVVDGIRFASKAEADRYGHLKLLEQNQFIYGLELQPKFPIHINGQQVCTYVADFRYRKTSGGDDIIEDVKGFKTPVYSLKKKLFEACYPHLKITEIK